MAAVPDAPPVVHSNPVTQSGFTMLPNVVLLRGDLSIGAKLVYAYLKHLAWRNGGEQGDVGLETISADLGVSKRALQVYIGELRKAPAAEGGGDDFERLVVVSRYGQGRPNTYLVNDPSDMAESADQGGGICRSPRVRDPFQVKTKGQYNSPPVPLSKVDGKPVKLLEWEEASVILDEFNRRAGTRLTKKTWAPKIIMRLREHPELTVTDHALIIERALRDPWWNGPATPSVVYGNAPLFERAMLAVSQPEDPSRGLTPEEMATYGTVWGPGTGYDSLPAARAAGSHPVIEGGPQ